MTDLSTYKLSNIDPEDISDVLLKIEKSFDFKFGDSELKDVKTFGELCDIITNKVQGANSNDCTTQQAFYRVRTVITDILSIDNSNITPDTVLQQLFPRQKRRQKIKEIEDSLGFKTKILRPKHWITGTLVLAFIVSLIGLFIFWKIGLIFLIISFFGLKLSDKFGNEFDLKTVGQLTEKITREQYKQVRRNKATINRNEIVLKVKELFKHDLDLEESALTREATFS